MPRYADTTGYSPSELRLWELLLSHQSQAFKTLKGLPFTYSIRGNELFVSRREKSITRATVNQAYRKATEKAISGPKQLGVFGASYLYPVFVELGIIPKTAGDTGPRTDSGKA